VSRKESARRHALDPDEESRETKPGGIPLAKVDPTQAAQFASAIMANLTKREIVMEIYRKSGFPQKQIVDTVQQTLDLMQKALANARNVELRNFGVLEVQVRKQRIGRNPNNPSVEVVIPQRAVVKFKSGKILKQQLKKIDLGTL
jgi:nucleoid DNA-binding protein